MSELFLEIVNMSISASWLVLAVLVLRFAFKKAPKWVNVLLWGIVAVRLVCPFSIESALSLIPSAETVSPEIMMDWTPEISTGIGSVDRVVNPIITATFAPEPIASANPLQILIPVSANFWLLGILVMLLYTTISYWRLRRKVREAVILRDNIYQSENVSSPFVLGIVNPRIYLSYNMDETDLSHVVAHEQAHIRRRDHWWKPLGFLLLTVYWFNPLMWLAYVLLCRDIELACDEKVIKELGNEQRADYSQALVSCSVNRRTIAACPLAFDEVGVKKRVKSVLNYKKPAFWLIVLAVVVCAVVAVCFLTNPPATHLDDIISENGFTVLSQEKHVFELTIPKNMLPDSIYSDKGCDFEENDIIVYATDTTKIYLMHVQFANEGRDRMYFEFNYSYEYPDSGQILVPYQVKDEGYFVNLASKNISDSGAVYENAVGLRAHGPGERFTLYVDTEVCRTASDYMVIPVFCNALTFTRGDGVYDHVEVVSKDEKGFNYLDDPAELIPGTTYVSHQCLYMNPLSSYAAIGGDSGCRYIVGEDYFVTVNRNSGNIVSVTIPPADTTSDGSDIQTNVTLVDKWKWQEFPYTDEEWAAMYFPDGLWAIENISEQYSEMLYQPLNADEFLLKMDDSLWLVNISNDPKVGTYIWSIYTLVPESAMGVAQWEYAPMLSSRIPFFRFDFELEQAEISAYCSGGLLGAYGVATDSSMTVKEGEPLYWSPVDKDGNVATTAIIQFSVRQADAPTYNGTIYIEGNSSSDGRRIYTATLVGTGLHLDPNTDAGGGVISAIGSQSFIHVIEHDLTTGDLEVPVEDLVGYVFYTNSEQISVKVKGGNFEGQVNLLDVSQNNAHILQSEVNTRNNDCLFTGLTSARLYRVDCEGLDGCTVVISGDK